MPGITQLDWLLAAMLAVLISGCGGDNKADNAVSGTSASDSADSARAAGNPPLNKDVATQIANELEEGGEFFRKEFGIEQLPEGSGRFTITGIDRVAQLVEQNQDETRLWRIAISPDGKTLAGAGNGLYLVLWDWQTQKQTLLQREVPDRYFSSVRFTPDGRHVIAAGERTEVWNVAERRLVGAFKADGWFTGDESFQAFDMLPENGQVVLIDSGRLGLWDVAEQRLLKEVEGFDYAYDVSVGDQGPIAVEVGDEAVLLDRSTLAEQKRFRIGAGTLDGIGDLEISPDGQSIATSEGETVTLWNVGTGRRLKLLGTTTDDVVDLCFSPSGRYLAAGGEDAVITIWNAESGQRLVEHDTKSEWGLEIEQMVFIGESHLATVTWNNTQVWPVDQLLERSAVPEKPSVRYILEDISNIRAQVIGFDPEGKWFVGGADKESPAEVRDRKTGQSLVTLEHSTNLQHADVSPNGKWVALAPWKMDASGFADKSGVWDTSTGKKVWTVPDEHAVYDIVCMDDGSVVFGTLDKSVRVMGADRSNVLIEDSSTTDIERAGSEILIAEAKGRLSAWKPGQDTKLRTIATVPGEIDNISVAADHQCVSVAYRVKYTKTFAVFEIASGKELARLQGDNVAQLDTIIPLSNKGPLLCVPGVLVDEPATLRDVTTGKVLAELRNGSNRNPKPVAFSPDGNTLVAEDVINLALYRTPDLLDVKHSEALAGLLALNTEFRRHDGRLRVEMSSAVVDDDLSLLAGLSEHFELALPADHQVTPDGFATLAEAANLTRLDLSDDETLEPADVAALSKVASLEELELPFLIENELIEPLGTITSLRRLDIRVAATPETNLSGLRGLTSLRQLEVSLLPNEQPVLLDWLTGMSDLQELELSLTSTDDQAVHLTGLTSLTRLTLPDGLSGTSVKHLAALKELREVSLPDGLNISKASLEQLGQAPIESLNLRPGMADDEAVSALKNWTHLRDLTLSAPITDVGLANIAGLATLESLNLGTSHVTDDGFQHLSGLKNLTELRPPRTGFTGTGLSHLNDLQVLRELDLRGTEVTADGFKALILLPHIEELWLPTHVTDEELPLVARIEALRILNLTSTQITDDGLAALSSLARLKQLALDRTSVSDAGLKHLMKLPSLAHINAAYSDITGDGVKAMNKQLMESQDRSIFVLR